MIRSSQLPLLLALALLPACHSSSSSGGDGGSDTDTDVDTDSDADTDVDADADTETDVDTEWDGGPLTPCEGDAGPDEVCVPGGTYLLGCMDYDTECEDNEYPLVEITLSPFFIEKYEATYGAVIEFLNTLTDGYVRNPTWVITDEAEPKIIWNKSWGGPAIGLDGDDQYQWGIGLGDEETCGGRTVGTAAGGFSWLGARLFCEWRGKRLPTESEWEAAARGQTALIWPCAWYHLPCWYGVYDTCDSDGECYLADDCCIPFDDDFAGNCEGILGTRGMYGNAAEFVLDWREYEGADHSLCEDGCMDPAPE